ncbi:MAG TPA: phage holin family protein [Candidatus Binatia bacterium]|nr:phage holin family protein [Candidatus Binatia bacterium]
MSVARAPLPSEEEPLSSLVQRLGEDIGRIVRAEIALAKVRVRAAVDAVKAASIGLVAAAIFAVGGIGALIAGLVLLVATVLTPWVAAFAVGGALLLLALGLVLIEKQVLTHGVNEALSPVDGAVEVRHGR